MGADKLWIDMYGRPAWRWSLDRLLGVPSLAPLALVTPSDSLDRFASLLPPSGADRCLLVGGGATRAESVLAGLAALSDAGCADPTLVLVHDAARPALSAELLERVIGAAGERGGVVPVLAVGDTLLRLDEGATQDRDGLLAAQTPQLGRLGELRAALSGGPFTDEASALLAAGVEVRAVAGDAANRKLTEPGDEELLRAVLAARSAPMGSAPGTSPGVRSATGFDAHRFEAGRPLRLGGLDWPAEPRGLAGHSDGDAALHAAIDALLGAAAAGDIGTLFPSGDPTWRDVDSRDLLKLAVARVREAGWRPVSLDLTIVARRPLIGPRRGEMEEALAAAVGVPRAAISVKGTTSDGLGFSGEEGLAAFALASVAPIE